MSNEQKRMSWAKDSRIFQNATGIPLKLDGLLLAFGNISVDIIAIDEMFQKSFRGDYNDGESLKEFITRRFEEDICNLLQKYL